MIILQPEKIWRQTRLSREGSRSAVNHLLSFLKEQGSFLAYLWAELSFSVLGLILDQKKAIFFDLNRYSFKCNMHFFPLSS